MSDMALVGYQQVLDELAQRSPEFAKERQRHQRDMKAWRRERELLSIEISQLQAPLIVTALNPALNGPVPPSAAADMAAAVLRTSHYLLDNDAPAALIRDLLETCIRMLEPC